MRPALTLIKNLPPAIAKELRNRDQRPVRYGRGVNFPLAN